MSNWLHFPKKLTKTADISLHTQVQQSNFTSVHSFQLKPVWGTNTRMCLLFCCYLLVSSGRGVKQASNIALWLHTVGWLCQCDLSCFEMGKSLQYSGVILYTIYSLWLLCSVFIYSPHWNFLTSFWGGWFCSNCVEKKANVTVHEDRSDQRKTLTISAIISNHFTSWDDVSPVRWGLNCINGDAETDHFCSTNLPWMNKAWEESGSQ